MFSHRWIIVLAGLALFAGTVTNSVAGTKHRLGVGVHYWMASEDIDSDNVDEDGFAWLITYQVRPMPLVKFEAALEMLPDGFYGSDEQVYAPQVYVVAGGWIYAGLGVGMLYSDGDFADDPFYAVRAGIDVPVFPLIHLDINANYRFTEWDNIETLGENVDFDTITIGAAVRIQI